MKAEVSKRQLKEGRLESKGEGAGRARKGLKSAGQQPSSRHKK